VRHVLGAEFVEVVYEGFNLGTGYPVFHFDSVDDGGFLDLLLILFDIRLFEVDAESDVTLRAVRLVWRC
jgi:hypothetical protein